MFPLLNETKMKLINPNDIIQDSLQYKKGGYNIKRAM